MLLSCPNCGTLTQVADVLIPSARLTATCSGCGAKIGGTVPSRLDSMPSAFKRRKEGGRRAGRKGAPEGEGAARAGEGGRGEERAGEGGHESGGVGGPKRAGVGRAGEGGRTAPEAGARPSERGSGQGASGSGGKGQGGRAEFRPDLGAASRGLDPERLARLVASDLLLYNRDKIQQAAAEGRLLSSMAGDIVEAWEFYKKRVGIHTALGTSYFRDALNSVVAGDDMVI